MASLPPSPDQQHHSGHSNKQALFEGAAPPLDGGASAPSMQQEGMVGTMANLSEAGDRLRERGEKLERLDEKSAELSDAASDFAKMAAQLNKASSSRWF
jgi:syntaxin-binding protein 5